MNKYLVRNFKWIENLGKVPAKVYRLVTIVTTYVSCIWLKPWSFTNNKFNNGLSNGNNIFFLFSGFFPRKGECEESPRVTRCEESPQPTLAKKVKRVPWEISQKSLVCH